MIVVIRDIALEPAIVSQNFMNFFQALKIRTNVRIKYASLRNPQKTINFEPNPIVKISG